MTGDIGHHDGIDAVEQGLSVIDAGHYGTEYIFIDDMKHFLNEKHSGIGCNDHSDRPSISSDLDEIFIFVKRRVL